MNKNHFRRLAFTLVELLVVIAIGGSLNLSSQFCFGHDVENLGGDLEMLYSAVALFPGQLYHHFHLVHQFLGGQLIPPRGVPNLIEPRKKWRNDRNHCCE